MNYKSVIEKPKSLHKLLGIGYDKVAIEDGVVAIHTRTGVKKILVSQLEHLPTVKTSLLSHGLHLGKVTLNGFSPQSAQHLLDALYPVWFEQKYSVVFALTNQIKKALSTCYLSTNEYEKLYLEALNISESFDHYSDIESLAPDISEPFSFLRKLVASKDYFLTHSRDAIIKKHTQAFQMQCSQALAVPITEQQMEASIVNEDHSLLMAAAGTGKTSVLMNKAYYLQKSNLAQAEEILCLSLNRVAAQLWNDRVSSHDNLGLENPSKAYTILSTALSIIESVEGSLPNVSVTIDKHKQRNVLVNKLLSQLITEDPQYREKVITFFLAHRYKSYNLSDYCSLGEYYKDIKHQNYTALNGTICFNYPELLIANFLIRHNIKYQYRRPYRPPVGTPDLQPYTPTFYLPEPDVYIDYICLDKWGRTPIALDSCKSFIPIKNLRKIHHSNATTLLECYHHEWEDNKLINSLRTKLVAQNVNIQALDDEEIISQLSYSSQLYELSKSLGELLSYFKNTFSSEDQFLKYLSTLENTSVNKAMLDLFFPILRRYQQQLTIAGQMDTFDVIRKAENAASSGSFKSKWKYLLVDDFQDSSQIHVEFLHALLQSGSGCKIFCAADDSQARSERVHNMDPMLEFHRLFSPTTSLQLEKSHRLTRNTLMVAKRFIEQNPSQTEKPTAASVESTKPTVFLHFARDCLDPLELVRLCDHLHSETNVPTTLFILCRHEENLPAIENILDQVDGKFSKLDIQALTIMGARGLEADYVVIPGLHAGELGFPHQPMGPDLALSLGIPVEDFPFAEERRQFYTAITRAKKQVILMADHVNISPFIQELLSEHYPVMRIPITNAQQIELELDINLCPTCETGRLQYANLKNIDQTRKAVCSNNPLCTYTEALCESCNTIRFRVEKGGQYFHICRKCKTSVPICPTCSHDMRFDQSKDAWVCTNSSPDNQPLACHHSVTLTSLPSQ